MSKILITPRSYKESGEEPYSLLRGNGCELIENLTGKTLSEEQMAQMCEDIDGLIVGIDPVTRKVIEGAKNLKAISKYGAGLDNIDLEAAKEYGIEVRRAEGTNATSVAELAVGLFFALARTIVPVSISTKNGGWSRFRGVELTGKTVGIVGLGNIGSEVSRMAYGLGMNILGYDPFVDKDSQFLKDYNIKLEKLDDILQTADFLSLHLPLTEETRYLINTDSIKMMKPTSYLVNTSRGELVNEDDLYEGLIDKRLAGAASDVFSVEPPGENSLVKLDNFILTSHVGAYTKEANQKMAIKSAINVIEMLNEIVKY